MPRPEVYRWEFEIPVPRPLLWHYVADTERLNRLAGLFPVRYTYQPLDTGGSEIHAEARSGGLTLRWIERPCEWIEPETFRFTRDYSSGPFLQLVSQVDLEDGPRPGATRLVHTITVTPRHFVGRLVARYAIGLQTRDGFARVYALAPAWAAGKELPALGDEGTLGAREHARRELERVLRPLAGRLDAVDVGERLQHLLLHRPDAEIQSLAPYALADEWHLDRRRTLGLFLHAARAGLLDLEYDLICPSCRRAKVRAGRMSEITQSGHCPTGNSNCGVDFERSIEVRFNPRPLGIGHEEVEYCHAGPGNTPHRLAGWNLAVGEERHVEVRPDVGKHQLASPQARAGVFFEVVDDPEAPYEARVVVQDGALVGVPPRVRAPLRLVLQSALPVVAEVAVSRTKWADDIVTAADLTAMQEFRDLFGAEILAPGAEFAIENQVFLFTDVVGSTALYERIGDAAAFALVRRHFDVLRGCYEREGGALVKTIGDAIMCVFRRGDAALRAAIAMHREVPAACEVAPGVPLRLRIGLHRGPCVAMTANDRIDYFGTTVNTAARVQGIAGANEIAVSPALLALPEVRAALAEARLPARTQELELKGLKGRHAITVLAVADPVP